MDMASGNPWGFFVMEIIVTPSKPTSGGTPYAAYLNGRLLCVSHTPFLTAACVLLKERFPSHVVITMRHEGSTHASMRSTIARAALAMSEDDGRPAEIGVG